MKRWWWHNDDDADDDEAQMWWYAARRLPLDFVWDGTAGSTANYYTSRIETLIVCIHSLCDGRYIDLHLRGRKRRYCQQTQTHQLRRNDGKMIHTVSASVVVVVSHWALLAVGGFSEQLPWHCFDTYHLPPTNDASWMDECYSRLLVQLLRMEIIDSGRCLLILYHILMALPIWGGWD